MEDAGCQQGVRTGARRLDEMLDRAGAPGGDHRDVDRVLHRGDQFQVETGGGAVGVHRVQQHLAGAADDRLPHPFQGVQAG